MKTKRGMFKYIGNLECLRMKKHGIETVQSPHEKRKSLVGECQNGFVKCYFASLAFLSC